MALGLTAMLITAPLGSLVLVGALMIPVGVGGALTLPPVTALILDNVSAARTHRNCCLQHIPPAWRCCWRCDIRSAAGQHRWLPKWPPGKSAHRGSLGTHERWRRSLDSPHRPRERTVANSFGGTALAFTTVAAEEADRPRLRTLHNAQSPNGVAYAVAATTAAESAHPDTALALTICPAYPSVIRLSGQERHHRSGRSGRLGS